MNDSDRQRLRKTHVKIVDDVRVKDVLPLLRQEGIINEDDEERVLAEKTRKDKIRFLVSLLPRRGPRAYTVFHQALIDEYGWIVEELDNVQVTGTRYGVADGAVSSNATQQITELNHKVLRKVAHNSDVLSDWKVLGRCLGLEENDIIEIEYANQANVKEASYQCLMKWQCRKGKEANAATLVTGLRDSGMTFLADELDGISQQ